MSARKCPQCLQVITPEDTLAVGGNQISHLDCRRPRELNYEERALLFKFCWDHDVAQCATCARSYRQHKLAADLFGWRIHLCPRCRTDLTTSMRGHLYACVLVPTEVRQRARDARDASRMLIKESEQLAARTDVLMREVEAAMAALRDALGRRTGN